MSRYVFFVSLLVLGSIACAQAGPETEASLIVSVPDQKLVLMQNGVQVAQFKISTSKFGLGDRSGSYATPLGELEIAQKIGAAAPQGTVFKGRRPTGEILKVNSRGRDPIVTRILWLRGLQDENRNAYARGIYIHGTPVEKLIGRPASYGCIRMRSRDVIKLFNAVGVGARINILNRPLTRVLSDVAAHHAGRGLAG